MGSPLTSYTTERDTRARAWTYIFHCHNRRVNQEAASARDRLDDARGGSKNDSSAERNCTA